MTADGIGLDPAVQAWLARIEALSVGRPALAGPLGPERRAASRVRSDLLAAEFTEPAPVGVAIDDLQVPGSAGPVRIRRYRPERLTGRAPTQVWLHGGGFHAGAVDEEVDDRLCAARAADAALQICSVDYRLAPEHPFPAAADDALAVIDALRADPDSVEDAAQLLQAYFGGAAPPPKASPLDEPDLTGLPPTLIMVAEHGPLCAAGLAFARRLEDAGVPVTVHLGAGHLHGTPALTAVFDRARRWQRLHARELARAYRTAAA